ncbi:hypothetical protein HYZ98_03355 [Candidatus Peregrinibacteria bacterium]|nr:hypothetical protein [Candidatus Peregrinibacteria bacterium]
MRRIIALFLATVFPITSLPFAEAAPAPTAPELPVLVATLSTVSTGRLRIIEQMERNKNNAMLHRLLQDHLRILNSTRTRMQTERNQTALERIKSRMTQDLKIIAQNQAEVRRTLLLSHMNTPRKSRRILKQEVNTRRETERCLKTANDPCSCSCGHLTKKPVPAALPSAATKRIRERSEKRVDRIHKRQQRIYENRRMYPLFPHSPRHTRARATEQDMSHEQRLERIRARYAPPAPESNS